MSEQTRDDRAGVTSTLGRHVFDALRGLVSATAFVGAASVLYVWAAPWLTIIVDNWREISRLLFSWLSVEILPEFRLFISLFFTFYVSGPLSDQISKLRNGKSQKFFDVVAILTTPLLMLSLTIYLSLSNIKEIHEASLSVIVPQLSAMYIVSFIFSMRFTVWFTIWVGIFFALDQAYRHNLGCFLEGPAACGF